MNAASNYDFIKNFTIIKFGPCKNENNHPLRTGLRESYILYIGKWISKSQWLLLKWWTNVYKARYCKRCFTYASGRDRFTTEWYVTTSNTHTANITIISIHDTKDYDITIRLTYDTKNYITQYTCRIYISTLRLYCSNLIYTHKPSPIC